MDTRYMLETSNNAGGGCMRTEAKMCAGAFIYDWIGGPYDVYRRVMTSTDAFLM